MKRLLLIVLLLALMMQPALADTCFYQQGVMLLHADPFCSGTPPEFLPLDAVSTDAPEAAVCAYCPICWRLMTQTDELDALRSRLPEPQRYFNPKGGEMYHYDAECVAVNKRYLPMTALTEDECVTKGLKPCGACTKGFQFGVTPLYMRSLAEKSDALPEVWDIPSAADLPEEQAVALATTALRNAYALGTDVLPGDFLTVTLFYPAEAAMNEPAYYRVCFATCRDFLDYTTWQVGYYADVHAQTGAILRMDAAH